MDNQKCAHELCNCLAAADSDFCSDHCKEAADQDIDEIKCDCGHQDCLK